MRDDVGRCGVLMYTYFGCNSRLLVRVVKLLADLLTLLFSVHNIMCSGIACGVSSRVLLL